MANGRKSLRPPSLMRQLCRTRQRNTLQSLFAFFGGDPRMLMEGSASAPPIKCEITQRVVVPAENRDHGRDV